MFSGDGTRVANGACTLSPGRGKVLVSRSLRSKTQAFDPGHFARSATRTSWKG
jgi:hypothetical protein